MWCGDDVWLTSCWCCVVLVVSALVVAYLILSAVISKRKYKTQTALGEWHEVRTFFPQMSVFFSVAMPIWNTLAPFPPVPRRASLSSQAATSSCGSTTC